MDGWELKAKERNSRPEVWEIEKYGDKHNRKDTNIRKE